ncbi:MAG: cyclic nucleotide-binding domain-containing protein [Rhodoferax sp.]|nr:cyclic nucleotide-binding domain-containing protein [Rhodoferax sp.]
MPGASASGALEEPYAGTTAHSLLDALTESGRAELLSIARPVSFLRGSVVLRQGGHTRGAFFILTGSAQASVRLPGGEDLIVMQVEYGGVIGEMSLLEHGTCAATVTALTNLDGLFVGRDEFRILVARRNLAALEVQQALTLNLCAKLNALNDQTLAWRTPEDVAYSAPAKSDPMQGATRRPALAFDYRRFLPLLPLFQDWDEDEIDGFADLTSVLQLQRGETLFFEGSAASACYVTVRGALDVAAPVAAADVAGTPSHLRRLAVLGPGHLIGYRSLIENSRHGTRVRACENSLLMELSSAHFLELYNGASSLSYRLQKVVHTALLRSMAHTNLTLARLVNMAKVGAANRAALQAAIAAQAI